MPADIFRQFSEYADFEHDPLRLNSSGKIKKVSDLEKAWNMFVEDEKVTINPQKGKEVSQILSPEYIPTERLLVQATLKKLRKELPKNLKAAFDKQFSQTVTIYSSVQTLVQFKNVWIEFLSLHAGEIDEELAKNLDNIIVTNGDLYREVEEEGIKINRSQGFSEQEHKFKRIFNQLATRQLFEEVKDTQEFVEKKIETIAKVFKEFPPYINELFAIYPYNHNGIAKHDAAFEKDITALNTQIVELEKNLADPEITEEQRAEFHNQILALQKQLNERKWK
jgi:hypothetical protein